MEPKVPVAERAVAPKSAEAVLELQVADSCNTGGSREHGRQQLGVKQERVGAGSISMAEQSNHMGNQSSGHMCHSCSLPPLGSSQDSNSQS